MSDFLRVNKKVLGQIIILVDDAEKLSEKLEENNQAVRVLLHSLVFNAKSTRVSLRQRRAKLLELRELAKEEEQ